MQTPIFGRSRRNLSQAALLVRVPASFDFAWHVGIGAVPALAGSPAISEAQADAMPRGGALRIAMKIEDISKPAIIDSNEKNNLLRQVCEYITITGQDNITRPYLAERWEASEDLRTWTFYLRKESNGKRGVRSRRSAAIWNVRHLLDPAIGSSVIGLMKGYMLTTSQRTAKPRSSSGMRTPSRRSMTILFALIARPHNWRFRSTSFTIRS